MHAERRSLIDSAELPDFDRPPVVEVSLSTSFDPLPRITAADLGALWELHYRRSGFPYTQDQPPIRVIPEAFGPGAGVPSLTVELATAAPTPRMWFVSEEYDQLIQVQTDWFARNWRRTRPEHEYPRYPLVRASFEEGFTSYRTFIEERDLGDITIRQCEVTYVNHIPVGEGWEGFHRLGDVLRLGSSPADRHWLPATEFARIYEQFLISDAEGRPMARLHVRAEPVFRTPDNVPMLQLTLTARGSPPKDGLGGVMEFLDLGRRWVVLGFLDITTAKMQEHWGLRRGTS